MDKVELIEDGLIKYEQPKIVDYGSLLELTKSGGFVHPSDVPKGQDLTAFPLS